MILLSRWHTFVRSGHENVRELLPEIPQLLMQATETEREAAWAEIEDALRQYDNVDEFVRPQTYLIGVGTK